MATTQYVVDIAANMIGGEKTISQLDTVTAKLTSSGAKADDFHDALAQVTNELTAAKAASVAANSALAAGEREFAGLERAALQTAKAAEKAALAGKLDPTVSRSAHEAAAAVDAYSLKLKGLETESQKAKAQEDKLATTLGNLNQLSKHAAKGIDEPTGSVTGLHRALGELGGPLGRIGGAITKPIEGFSKLSGAVGESNAVLIAGAAASVALVVAVVAVAAAAAYAAVQVAAWAVGLADANRNTALAGDAAEAMDQSLVPLRGTIAALVGETGQSADALRGLEKSLKAAKVSAADMPGALRAAALAETALGKGGSADFVAQITAGRVAVKALSADVSSKLGPIVAQQMLGLDAQSARLKSNISAIFGGLKIEPVLNAFHTLVDLFDANSASGQAMKLLFESVFQPLIDQAQNAAYVVEAFVLGFLIGMTEIYIAAKPAIKAVSALLGFDDTTLTDVLGYVKIAGEAAAFVIVGFTAVAVGLAVAIGVCLAPFVLLQVAVYALIAAVVTAAYYVDGAFISAFEAVKDFLGGLAGEMIGLGSNLIAGLVSGITGAAGSVVDAVTGAVGGAITSAKKLLGIASPSKVFAEIGGNTAAGLAGGIEDGTGDVHDAFAAMVEPPDAPTSSLAAQDIGGSGTLFTGAANPGGGAGADQKQAAQKSKPVPASVVVNITGVKDAADAIAQLKEAMTLILEGDAASVGGAEAVPA